jgi:hypothetical protein
MEQLAEAALEVFVVAPWALALHEVLDVMVSALRHSAARWKTITGLTIGPEYRAKHGNNPCECPCS